MTRTPEENINYLLFKEKFDITVPRLALYSDEELRSNSPFNKIKGQVNVSWTMEEILKIVTLYGLRLASNEEMRRFMSTLRDIEYNAMKANRITDKVLELGPSLDQLKNSLLENQPRLMKEIYSISESLEFESINLLEVNRLIFDNNNSKAIVKELIKPTEPIYREKDLDVISNPVHVERLRKENVELVEQMLSERVSIEMYSHISSNTGSELTAIEEFSKHYDLHTNELEVSYDTIVSKQYLLRLMSYEEIGRVMRTKGYTPNVIYDKFRFNADKSRVEYLDKAVGWYPVVDSDVLDSVLDKFDFGDGV